jgi:FAD:protein FMN transferase
MADIHQFNHRAMATYFEVRIADEERTYAAQAAQAAFDLLEKLESHLSRFRASSDIAQIAELTPGGTMRLSEPAFACL